MKYCNNATKWSSGKMEDKFSPVADRKFQISGKLNTNQLKSVCVDLKNQKWKRRNNLINEKRKRKNNREKQLSKKRTNRWNDK